VSIRLRLSLWYAAILFVSLTLLGALDYHEILEERQHRQRRHPHRAFDEEEDDTGMDILQIGLACGLPAAVLGLGGGWWLMRRALAPVASLTRAVETLQESNLRQQLPRSGNHDEIDRLIQVFNAMTARLDESFNRVREFTLHASHELKTPVTILHAELETALASPDLAPPHRELLESQLDELQRLAKIVDGLTLLTKADAGLISLQLEPVRLDELVRDAVEDARILAQDAKLSVALEGCEETLVRGDRHRLRQLLLNLTDNAVKYSQTPGQISLALRRKEGFAEITVSNTGPGLPPEVASRVFDRFFRGDASLQRSREGCGLGLSISQWIATAHGGKINFTTRSEGPTMVQVLLPLAANPP
jgi:signal transduction histidine kinase